MVHVVITRVIARQMLEGIPRQGVSTMIIYSLKCGASEEAQPLARGHSGEFVGDGGAKGIEEKTFKRVIVKGAVGIGDVEAMVAGVKCCCEA